LKNSKKDDVSNLEKERNEAISRLRNAGGIHISGNHSLEGLSENPIVKRDGVLFLHGDVVEWGFDYASKWRMKRKGLPVPYWHLLKIYRKLFPGNSSFNKKVFMERSVILARMHNCHTVVIGHFHVKKLVDMKYMEVRIVVVPRGPTVISL
jgi:hypothetical protein